jgi:hypothetical protein
MRGAYSLVATARPGDHTRSRTGGRGTARRDLDAHRALQVGPADLGTELVEDRDHRRVGVPVPVVASGADDRHLRSGGPEERRIGRGRAMVGHREQVDVEQVRAPPPRREREQVGLGGRLGITGD